MSIQQKNLVYALWQEVPKLVYAFWTCKPVKWWKTVKGKKNPQNTGKSSVPETRKIIFLSHRKQENLKIFAEKKLFLNIVETG